MTADAIKSIVDHCVATKDAHALILCSSERGSVFTMVEHLKRANPEMDYHRYESSGGTHEFTVANEHGGLSKITVMRATPSERLEGWRPSTVLIEEVVELTAEQHAAIKALVRPTT